MIRQALYKRFAAAIWLGVSIAASCQAYTRIVVFGDSLSDVGNTSSITFGSTPGQPYWQGRFSNGPVWIEYFGQWNKLAVIKSRSGGYNYAYGGSETGSGYEFIVIPNMITQVNQYLTSRTPNASELYVLWAGGNDYLNGQLQPSVPAQNIDSQVRRLYAAGARHFLVPNLPLLGFVPRNVGTSNEALFNSLSSQHNALLSQKMWVLEATFPDIEIGKMDVQRMMTWIRYNPLSYGFLNVTEPAYDGTNVVPKPNTYAFWDDIHPTTNAHALVAEVATECLRQDYLTAIGDPY